MSTKESPNTPSVNMEDIIDKYNAGGVLTDHEVGMGVRFFVKMSKRLSKCGPVFHLAFKEACRLRDGLESIQAERKR